MRSSDSLGVWRRWLAHTMNQRGSFRNEETITHPALARMSIWQHILKFCEDNRRQKKKKTPSSSIPLVSSAGSRWGLEGGSTKTDLLNRALIRLLSLSIHLCFPTFFSTSWGSWQNAWRQIHSLDSAPGWAWKLCSNGSRRQCCWWVLWSHWPAAGGVLRWSRFAYVCLDPYGIGNMLESDCAVFPATVKHQHSEQFFEAQPTPRSVADEKLSKVSHSRGAEGTVEHRAVNKGSFSLLELLFHDHLQLLLCLLCFLTRVQRWKTEQTVAHAHFSFSCQWSQRGHRWKLRFLGARTLSHLAVLQGLWLAPLQLPPSLKARGSCSATPGFVKGPGWPRSAGLGPSQQRVCVLFLFEKQQSWKCSAWGGREGGRWNVPAAAGTCLHHRNAGKTRHAALAAVCAHSPSRCRQLLMLLSKFNVTFFSLLLFLAGLLFSLLFLLLSYSHLPIS